ncbi:DUF4259 domain-containing protein [Actinorugispora endophytica]|uniref:DUF4259 domain-containing protein n=1 Tax=Actinorugispora endophytica TaxID=1605990 RepID=UPI001FB6F114|nr:DUF4259 domain-containing protein [Actinorugispora endophytica]
MSASGVGPFENDSAMDLLDELRGLDEGEVIDALREALSSATEVEPGDYLDRDLGEPAVAASAVALAKIKGRDSVLEAVELLDAVPEIPSSFFSLVVSALSRVLQEDSEAYGLWVDEGLGDEWKAEVERLLNEASEVAQGASG